MSGGRFSCFFNAAPLDLYRIRSSVAGRVNWRPNCQLMSEYVIAAPLFLMVMLIVTLCLDIYDRRRLHHLIQDMRDTELIIESIKRRMREIDE